MTRDSPPSFPWWFVRCQWPDEFLTQFRTGEECLLRDLAERRGRHGATHQSRKRNDRQSVRDHLNELRGDELRTLELDLECLRGGEEQTREPCAHRIPATEDRRGECDEATTSRHLIGEL